MKNKYGHDWVVAWARSTGIQQETLKKCAYLLRNTTINILEFREAAKNAMTQKKDI